MTWQYSNPDKRCLYPNDEPSNIDYCWGYALAADNNTLDDFKKFVCPACDLWEPNKKEVVGLTCEQIMAWSRKKEKLLRASE